MTVFSLWLLFQNQELVTEGEVSRVGGSESDQVPRLQDKVAELQAEVRTGGQPFVLAGPRGS